jgi:hypothetical protein
LLTIVLVLVAVGLFVVGVVWPHWSRRAQRQADQTLRPLEQRANQLPGWLGWLAKSPFFTSRKVTDVSSEKGREARDKLPVD